MNEKLRVILKVILFFACIFLVIYGQQTVGKEYLFLQLIGLAGLIALLWNYNRKFT